MLIMIIEILPHSLAMCYNAALDEAVVRPSRFHFLTCHLGNAENIVIDKSKTSKDLLKMHKSWFYDCNTVFSF